MSLPFYTQWSGASATGISTAVAIVAATPLVMTNGQEVPNIFAKVAPYSSKQFDFSKLNAFEGSGIFNTRNVALRSASNLSAINFVITGYTQASMQTGTPVAVSETLAGPNANAVFSANQYSIVLSIVPSATSANTVDIGYGGGELFWRANHFLQSASYSQEVLMAGAFSLGSITAFQSLYPVVTYSRTRGAEYPVPAWTAVANFTIPANTTTGSVVFNDAIVRSALMLNVANPAADFSTNTGIFTWTVIQQGNVGF